MWYCDTCMNLILAFEFNQNYYVAYITPRLLRRMYKIFYVKSQKSSARKKIKILLRKNYLQYIYSYRTYFCHKNLTKVIFVFLDDIIQNRNKNNSLNHEASLMRLQCTCRSCTTRGSMRAGANDLRDRLTLPDPPAEFSSVLTAAPGAGAVSFRAERYRANGTANTHNRIIEISWLIRAH